MRFTAGAAAMLAIAAHPGLLLAHGAAADDGNFWQRWDFSPSIVVPLLLAISWYVRGITRLWQKAGVGRGVSRGQVAAYAAGVAVLILALVSPLAALAGSTFSWHMVQHLLLIVVAPPLLVAAAPETAFLWALAPHCRSAFGRFSHRVGAWLSGSGDDQSALVVAVSLAAGALWLWHIPGLYDLAVRNEAVHYAEHLTFLTTALLFWTSILRLRPRAYAAIGARIVAVFAMALQGSMLGALITFAARPLYASYLAVPGSRNTDALTDQQLAGLLMWVPPGVLYALVAGWLFFRWLDAAGAGFAERNAALRNGHRAS